MARKFSKTVITRLQRPMGTDPFRLLLVPLRPPCGPNMSSNGGCHLRWFPRKFLILLKKIALVKKRQTPVQSLTKDERIAMAEREI